ncbi:hypothetical protein HYPSUDRAFT_851820 [Hypholoma sublateritium FD-334 SS-4]|uniref:Uncharacterized protein n=1 Tax=Hypholoma sublateritium (strain FD-334 SS-4) TaxID=945553 RepID=A0A0D2NTE6_HYPSF|nr:hypothetical protein HYPSUDRAFT_851820 [Hypholoma sublateritium FD-334 SS-4]
MDSDSIFEEEPTVVVEDSCAEKSSIFSDWLSGLDCPPELEDAYIHNRPLTEAERAKLTQIEAQVNLPGRKRTITELDAQIEDLQRRRDRLVKETIALSGSLGRLCERLGAPIRRVPFEVLREIAAYSHPSQPAPTLAQFKSAFAGVCSTWRDAALSSPQLWATLYIRIGSRASLKAAGVSEWFRRANGHPITLYLDFVRNPGTPMARLTDITHFFRSISPSLVCLSHLGIRARNLDTLKSLFEEPLNWDISELHQLDIRTHFLGGLKLSSPQDPLKLFKSPPPLTRLTLAPLIDNSQSKAVEWAERWPPSWVSPRIFNFDAQWSQLTYIRLSAPIDLGLGRRPPTITLRI